jgi:hypothetical protein
MREKYRIRLPDELAVFVTELADLTGKTKERAVADAVREAVRREAAKRGNRA